MTTYLFVGPTLPRAEISGLADFTCLPPASMGDVYRAAGARPRAIGIIDGYFEGVPAVWHKEILWAMSQGIHVFGSASMGALRAAELHAFGMRGVGRIFEAYRAGELEDDDEVAVVHGPAEAGYVCLSEPMVNIRATLQEAGRRGIVSPSAQAELIERAKRLFYQDRSWQRILMDGSSEDRTGTDLQRLRDWLPIGRIDRKRSDALEMIAAMREFLAGNPEPQQPDFKFEWTDMWDVAIHSMSTVGGVALDGARFEEDWVLDELRLDEPGFETMRQRALLRFLARQGGPARSKSIDAGAAREAEQQLRLQLGLFRRADVEHWCADNGLDPAQFARLTEDQARLAAVVAGVDPALKRDLLDELRLDGSYVRYRARARHKRSYLVSRGQEDVTPTDCSLTPIALVAWHFEHRIGQTVPDDLAGYTRRLGMSHLADFYRVLAREWLYSQRG
jgi:hypothetical protein